MVEPRENLADGRQWPPISGAELGRYGRVLLALCRRLWRQRLLKTEERKDILQETMYKTDEFVFSGQESIGLIAFPPLHRDVSSFVVEIEDLALRFDFRDEPVETVNIAYLFDREVYKARRPRPAEQ